MKRRVEDDDLADKIHNASGFGTRSGTTSTYEDGPQAHPRKKRATSRSHSEVAPGAHRTNQVDLVRNINALSASEFQFRFLPPQSPLLTFSPNAGEARENPANNLTICFKASSELGESDLEKCFSLLQETSSEAYKNSVVRWRPKAKKREMHHPDMRYLIVRMPDSLSEASSLDQSDLPILGFLSFMVVHDDDYEYAVLYVYEIHLSETLRGCGVGAHLMHIAETIAQRVEVTKVMLTVFTSNTAATKFYQKIGFSKDGISPEPKSLRNGLEKPPDYVIMSKNVAVTVPAKEEALSI